jgi:excisionase family DNA binding protein
METANDGPLLKRREAASRLGVSVDSVDRLIRNGELAVVRIGRSVLIPQEDVLELVTRYRRARPRTPTCHRCRRRISGPRLVVGGLWTCAACVYEQEHPARAEHERRGDRR